MWPLTLETLFSSHTGFSHKAVPGSPSLSTISLVCVVHMQTHILFSCQCFYWIGQKYTAQFWFVSLLFYFKGLLSFLVCFSGFFLLLSSRLQAIIWSLNPISRRLDHKHRLVCPLVSAPRDACRSWIFVQRIFDDAATKWPCQTVKLLSVAIISQELHSVSDLHSTQRGLSFPSLSMFECICLY